MWSILVIAATMCYISTTVSSNEFPIFFKTHVTIFSGEKLCGGTLIAPKYVLTNARCIDGFLEQFHVKTIPSMSVEITASGAKHDVNTFRILGLNSNLENNDSHSRLGAIGLLELVKSVVSERSVKYNLRLSGRYHDLPPDTELLVIGSQKMAYDAKGRHLYITKLPVKIVPLAKCKNYYPSQAFEDNPTKSCAVTGIKKFQINEGDPVTKDDQLIGVVEESAPGQPILFTKLSGFVSLIKKNMQHALNCDPPSCYNVSHSAVTNSLECGNGDDETRQCLVNF